MARSDSTPRPRSIKEALARVLDDPTRERFRDMLKEHTGETANLDFKATWPPEEKLARHVLALANSGGGCIVIGVAEQSDKTLDPAGLSELTDKVDVTKKLNRFLPDSLVPDVHVDDFSYDASDYAALQGKKFQLLSVIPDAVHLPFIAERGSGNTRGAAIYVRRGTESVEANQEELQRIINRRLETGHSTAAAMKLEDHLDQLQVLQDRIPRFIYHSISDTLAAATFFGTRVGNPSYPKEDAQAFIVRMFEAKKKRIERAIDSGE